MEQKPEWMTDHEASDNANFKNIHESLARIEIKLDPIFENYRTASKMGKWLMAVAVFGSVILGVILSIKALFVR